MTEPKIEYRAEMPYLAIGAKVTMKEVPVLLPPLIPEVFSWLQKNGVEARGPLFFHYLRLENNLLDVQVGVPVAAGAAGDGRVKAGVFPAGTYLVTTHLGDYAKLPQAHSALEAWRAERGISFTGERTEFYPTDPATEPDPAKWQTDIVCRLVEGSYKEKL